MAKGSGLQSFTIRNFKTVNISSLPFKIPDDNISFMVNMDINTDGTLSQRQGTKLIEQLTENVKLFTFYELRDGTVYEQLLALGNNTLYKYNDTTGSFDIVTDTLSSNTNGALDWNGIGYINKFIFSNGLNVYIYKYDTTTSSYTVTDITNTGDTSSGTVNPPKAKLWEEFNSRVFAAGDGTENLMWSNVGDIETWGVNDFIALGGKPTALKAVGKFLFIGTTNGLFKLEATNDANIPFRLSLIAREGVLPNTLIEVKAGVVGCFLEDGRFIVFDQFAQSGSQIDDTIGYPIQTINEFLEVNDNINTIDDKVNKRILFVITTRNFRSEYFNQSSINNTQLVLNKTTGGWTFYNLKILNGTVYKNKVYISDFNNNVLQFDSDVYNDNGADIVTHIEFKIYDFGNPEIHKNFRDLFLTINAKTTTSIKLGYRRYYELVSNFTDIKDYFAYGGFWDLNNWDEFLWDGIYNQVQKSRIYLNGKGLQIILDKVSGNSDLQITQLTFTFYPSYKQGRLYE